MDNYKQSNRSKQVHTNATLLLQTQRLKNKK